MSFADPLVLTPVGGSAVSLPRISDGKYMHPGSTMDQPTFLIIKNTLKPVGVSRFVVEYQTSKNVPGQVGQPIPADDLLRTYTVFEVPHRSFSDTDVINHLTNLRGFMGDSALVARLLTGQK